MNKDKIDKFSTAQKCILNYFSYKTILFIENSAGQKIFDNNDILKEAAQFYKVLYTKNNTNVNYDIHEDLKNIHTVKLSNEQSQSLEGLVT